MSGFISLEGLRRQYPDEADCRELLEKLVWPKGAYCPHCGSLKVWRFRASRKSRPGLFQCGEKECRRQFTVTTKMPLHATKVPLWTWIAAMYLMLSSSKGISSVVMARYIGVTQPTAWKICHAIRELMDLRHELEPVLSGTVEVDTKRLGGVPKYRRNVRHRRGRGSKKPIVLVAAERKGQIRARLIKSESAAEMGSVIDGVVAKNATLMSDADSALIKIGKAFKAHHTVVHSKRQYVENDARTGTADQFASMLEDRHLSSLEPCSPPALHR